MIIWKLRFSMLQLENEIESRKMKLVRFRREKLP